MWLGFAAVENAVGNFSVYSDFNSVFCLQRDHTSKIPYKPYKLKNFFEKFNFEHENFFLEQPVCSCFLVLSALDICHKLVYLLLKGGIIGYHVFYLGKRVVHRGMGAVQHVSNGDKGHIRKTAEKVDAHVSGVYRFCRLTCTL